MKIEFDSSRKILLIDYIDSDDITPGDQDDINAFIDFAKSVLRRRVGTKPPVVNHVKTSKFVTD